MKPLLNLVTGLTEVLLAAVSSQSTSRRSYWVKMSSHKTWQDVVGPTREGRGEESSYWRLVRVGKPMEYLKEELLCEAVLVPGFGTLQAVQGSCSFFGLK